MLFDPPDHDSSHLKGTTCATKDTTENGNFAQGVRLGGRVVGVCSGRSLKVAGVKPLLGGSGRSVARSLLQLLVSLVFLFGGRLGLRGRNLRFVVLVVAILIVQALHELGRILMGNTSAWI